MVSTTTTMITTCAANWSESILQDMKEYVPDLITTTKVLNLLLGCYRNCSGPPRLGEGERGETEEEKAAGYPERALSLLRDIKSIRDRAEADETVAAADDEGKEEEEDDDWVGNFGKNTQ